MRTARQPITASPAFAAAAGAAIAALGALLIAASALLALQAAPAWAADHDVWVEGVQITDENASDVLGDGTVRYDAQTATLTLTGASLTQAGQRARRRRVL